MKTVYKVVIVIPLAGLTVEVASINNYKDAECEARRLHSIDDQIYKVIKVVELCVYKIS